ncbi:uncharacterized protein LOC120906844 [Anopheles arabiensis]|uniref:uncharacterized protein LOC120906844 n=1 Tax=Anopheles arabiensis TaxID=7173 RepID=UPI001AACD3D8|nr:uncharacterized protein LOC120906844 [Anopheles arabiensis]
MPKPKFDCVGCDRENAVSDMVRCDACSKWWHFDCAGVSKEVKYVKWVCERCESGEKDEAAKVKGHEMSGKPSRATRGKAQSQDGDTSKTRLEKPVEVPLQQKPADQKLASSKVSLVATPDIVMAQRSVRSETGTAPTNTAHVEKNRMAPSLIEGFSSRCEINPNQKDSASHVSRRSKSSVATTLKLERLAKERRLEVEALQTEMSKRIAKLNSDYEAMKQQIEDGSVGKRSGRSVSETSQVVDWLTSDHKRKVFPNPCTSTAEERESARRLWGRKLPAFSGSIKQWPVFYSYYNRSTEACGFTSVENIIRLEEALTGPAREVVESKFTSPDAAPQVMKLLKQLYGRPGLLVKELIEQARQIENPKPERLDQLISFGIAVQKLCDHLTANEMEDHFSNPELLEELVRKLPANRALEWVRFKRNFVKPTLKEFCAFMEELTEDCCELTVPANVEALRAPPRNIRGHSFLHVSNAVESASRVNTNGQNSHHAQATPSRTSVKCYVCEDPMHRVRQCGVFRAMTVTDRHATVSRLQLCANCLGSHGTRPCKSTFVCRVVGCGIRHHTLLHQEPSASTSSAQCYAHVEKSTTTLFRIVPVTVYHGQRSIDTYAFLDEGSSLTLVETSLAQQLGLEGVRDPLELCWTGNYCRREESSQRVQLEISARGGERRYSIAAAHTINQLSLPTQSIDTSLILNLNYFQELPAIQYRNAVPQLLIGLQDVSLMKPLEVRSGQEGQPIAVRSLLGWSIYGPKSIDGSTAATPFPVHRHERISSVDETVQHPNSMDRQGLLEVNIAQNIAAVAEDSSAESSNVNADQTTHEMLR